MNGARRRLETLPWLMLIGSVFAPQPFGNASERMVEIRVQILDSRTHRPLKGRRVQLTFSGMDGQWYAKSLMMVGRTTADGVATFQVRQPLPPLVDVVDLQAYPCSHPEEFSTREILEQGVVAQVLRSQFKKVEKWCAPDPQAPQPQRQLGQVEFFVHPLNRWQYAWYDTWR